jgi:5-methyltetrahydrofolate--homocysteine methyltransferase
MKNDHQPESGNREEILQRLQDSIVQFDFDGIKGVAQEAIEARIPAYEAVMEGLSKGMDVIGDKFSKGEAFLSELIMAGETMKEAMQVLEPHMKIPEGKTSGVVVLGTVYGDMHDLGKNIVALLLQSAGFKVIDLGVDVSSQSFVDAVKENNADVLAMSSLVTTTMPHMKEAIEELSNAGLRGGVKVLVGGAPVDDAYAESIGADGYGKDAVSAVEICRGWMK